MTNIIINSVIYYYARKLVCVKYLCNNNMLINDIYNLIAEKIATMSVDRYC